MSEKFGQYLKRRRETVGLTQSELAGRAGVTAAYIGDIERGNDSMGDGQELRPMLDVVKVIAEALGVPVTEVRRAAGYDEPEGFTSPHEVVDRKFDGGEFATLQRMHAELDTTRRRAFRPVLNMIRRELELLLNEQAEEPDARTQTFGRRKSPLGRTA